MKSALHTNPLRTIFGYFALDREQISRSGVFLKGITDASKRVESMLDARRVTDKSELDPKPFAFTPIFVLIEQVIQH